LSGYDGLLSPNDRKAHGFLLRPKRTGLNLKEVVGQSESICPTTSNGSNADSFIVSVADFISPLKGVSLDGLKARQHLEAVNRLYCHHGRVEAFPADLGEHNV
jgi:hypothetical protein